LVVNERENEQKKRSPQNSIKARRARYACSGVVWCSCTVFVGVWMFAKRRVFQRTIVGIEYDLTDAVTKRIEAQSPYKVISSHDRADSVLSGEIVAIEQSVLSVERETGRALENEVVLRAVVNWKNLKTGQLLLDNSSVSAAGSFSRLQSQSFKYGSNIAANNLAGRIVEVMEDRW
jgi:hypothetical protein